RQGTLQHSRRNQYKEHERAYFEHLIVETSVGDNWTIREIGNKDVQELAEEEEEAEEAEEAQLMELDKDDNESIQSDYSVGSDEPPSSPVADGHWEETAQLLRSLAGEHDVASAEGLQEIRRRTDGGSEQMLKIRWLVKQLARTASAVEKVVEVAEDANGTDAG
ncbi:hypothetical protein EDD11_000681, partial [Mortierella claussenii]